MRCFYCATGIHFQWQTTRTRRWRSFYMQPQSGMGKMNEASLSMCKIRVKLLNKWPSWRKSTSPTDFFLTSVDSISPTFVACVTSQISFSTSWKPIAHGLQRIFRIHNLSGRHDNPILRKWEHYLPLLMFTNVSRHCSFSCSHLPCLSPQGSSFKTFFNKLSEDAKTETLSRDELKAIWKIHI